ncbi:hypothetical protein [Rhizobium sp. RU36D]|uniref:hypothetical protein n=1 Tax=Rhizobium sp. RU36D TaxID=1907415 RepID=UPI0009D83E33|nr:hypothetical protein [Rhizobium sp. RU36D]SMD17318.1 hypothetical protein SAMN05880593_13218 [Rhizobium sp. RU36D]
MHRHDEDLTPEEARQDHWDMLRFLGLNALVGMGLGLAVAGALIWLDIGGLAKHLSRSSAPILPALMIALPLALTFAAAVTASAVMLMPYKKKKQR